MILQLSNCKRCGTAFPKGYREICQNCFELENNQVQRICNFVETKTTVSTYEISSYTQIDIQNIEYYLKKGRLSRIVKKLSVQCKICGTTIYDVTKQGFMCDKCVKEMGIDPKKRHSIEQIDKSSQKTIAKLKKFDKNVMHTNKEETLNKKKYGFKKDYEL